MRGHSTNQPSGAGSVSHKTATSAPGARSVSAAIQPNAAVSVSHSARPPRQPGRRRRDGEPEYATRGFGDAQLARDGDEVLEQPRLHAGAHVIDLVDRYVRSNALDTMADRAYCGGQQVVAQREAARSVFRGLRNVPAGNAATRPRGERS